MFINRRGVLLTKAVRALVVFAINLAIFLLATRYLYLVAIHSDRRDFLWLGTWLLFGLITLLQVLSVIFAATYDDTETEEKVINIFGKPGP